MNQRRTNWPFVGMLTLFICLLSSCVVLPRDVEGICESGPPLEPTSSFTCRDEVDAYLREQTEFDAFVAMRDAELLVRWGDYDRPLNAASVRKSIISVLFGIAHDRGMVDLDTTLAELDVGDEEQPLTDVEKSATIRHLLQARSGVYLPSIGLPDSWEEVMPPRGTYQPGEFWFYNNWDFNALAKVFEKATGLRVEDALSVWLAEPLGMRSYCADHVTYQYEGFTEHPMWRVYISAQDLGLIGAMMMQDGEWRGEQVVSEAWVEESTTSYSNVRELRSELDYTGYGYLWWTDDSTDTIWADGSGGQYMVMNPSTGTVIVTRNNHGNSVPGRVWNNISPDSAIGREHAEALLQIVEDCR